MKQIKNIGDVETLPIEIIVKQPIKASMDLLFNHIGRYVIAVRKLQVESKDVVIDASCGKGYGTYYLSKFCKKVYGLDIYKENLDVANKCFKTDNITFSSYFDMMKRRGSVNKIFCIETFEHIEKNKQDEFIKRLLSILKVNGSMFLTVPIGEDKPSTYNKFHKNEPSIQTIYNMFNPHFKKIDIEISSFINSYNKESTYAFVTLKRKRGNDINERNRVLAKRELYTKFRNRD